MCGQEGGRPPSNGPDRRRFLLSAVMAGAGAAALGGMAASPATAAVTRSAADVGRWEPDTESQQFTLAVMPDTQFLYWGTQGSINPEPQEESFRYIIRNSGSRSGGG